MKTIRLPVAKEETFYVANDGKKFTTAYECMLHEYRVAVTDATVNFDFAFANNCKTMFTLVYHANLNIVLAEDLSIIINHLWDVEHTNMADNYEPGVILDTLEHRRGCPFEDGHRYSFAGERCYMGEDHDDNFYMYIEDVSEDHKASVYMKRKDAVLNSQAALDFKKMAEQQANEFGRDTMRRILLEFVNEICGPE